MIWKAFLGGGIEQIRLVAEVLYVSDVVVSDDFRRACEFGRKVCKAFLPARAFPGIAMMLEAYLLDGLILKAFDGLRKRVVDQFADEQIDAAFDAVQRQVVFFA